MAQDNIYGFDPEIVRRSIGAINDAYAGLKEVLVDKIQNEFIEKMAQIWASNHAIRYFRDEFKPSIDDLNARVNFTFKSVVNAMNSAAIGWARKTENAYTPIEFLENNKEVVINSVSEKFSDNKVGINFDIALSTVESVMNNIQNLSLDRLNQAVEAVRNCGFLGGDQASTLYASLGTIKDSVIQTFEICKKNAQNRIDETVQEYGAVATNTTEKFQIHEV